MSTSLSTLTGTQSPAEDWPLPDWGMCATDSTVHGRPPMESFRVRIVVQDGKRAVGDVLDLVLNPGSATSLQHPRWPDLRRARGVAGVVCLLLQQHVVPRLERRLGAIPATTTHQSVALYISLLRYSHIPYSQKHHPLRLRRFVDAQVFNLRPPR